MQRRALVVGSEGQDGRILFERLRDENVAVIGLGRGVARDTDGNDVIPVDLSSRDQIRSIVELWRPDEIYYLAAVHQASQDPLASDDSTLLDKSLVVHVSGPSYFLEELKRQGTGALFYAGSSLVFGDVASELQDELTPFRPTGIYGITKAAGIQVCEFYRTHHKVRASAGILFNHESPLRSASFVSQKIVKAATAIARGSSEKLTLGDLSARIDWGYAPDFVDAMIRIVRDAKPDTYVVATGEAHSVREFVEIAFGRLGLDWRAHVVEDKRLLTRLPVTRVGDSARLRAETGWRPQVTFVQMVETLLDSAYRDVT